MLRQSKDVKLTWEKHKLIKLKLNQDADQGLTKVCTSLPTIMTFDKPIQYGLLMESITKQKMSQ